MKQANFKKKFLKFLGLLLRPFIDFYYNYGLTRASVLSYVLCANLIIFVYLFMTIGITVAIDPLVSPSSARRFLELHFLWPSEEKILIEENPMGFKLNPGNLVTAEEYQEALSEYCKKYNLDVATIQEEGKLKVSNFSITASLGKAMHEATRTFYNRNTIITPLGFGFFIILGIAYFALILRDRKSVV